MTANPNYSDALMKKLQECVGKVPAGVNSGSYQKAVDFKAWVVKANKAIKKGERNEQALRSLIGQYEGY